MEINNYASLCLIPVAYYAYDSHNHYNIKPCYYSLHLRLLPCANIL